MTQLMKQSEGQVLLQGDIDFDSVVALRNEGFALLDQQTQLAVDCSAVGRAGSAAAALFIAWLRYAKSQQKDFQLVNMPPHLQRVLKVSGLGSLIS
ncbi:MAG: STAS domain-containing protein [Oceanospirillaceae bacterium]|nr:STAS domain-containing protein [Oceanospirillaceae bacterium]